MRLLRERPTRRRIISAASLWGVAAVTVSCSATPVSTGPPPPVVVQSTRAAPSHATPTNEAAAFTVTGNNPVQVNGSQDTHAATPNAVCDSVKFATDKSLGSGIVDGFSLENFPAAADLLTHFLNGNGTEIDYGLGSTISREAVASSAFRTVNEQVQGEIAVQLRAKGTRVQLSAEQLPTVLFGSKSSDLYWGFRGTQGLTVTGSGTRKHGKYFGSLTYVIRDSYGFPADDTLDGFGAPMRYLQTVCGAPHQVGGAHWFPDTITVRVPFTA
jgi:hypothetical protein